MNKNIKKSIRDIPNYPKEGINFKDITPIFLDPILYQSCIQKMANPFLSQKIDIVLGTEARGFLFAPGISQILKAGFMPIRKPNKLPGKTHSIHYDLEYGSDMLCLHQDQMPKSSRVLLVDDVLATGGTMEASIQLIQQAGGIVVGCSFLIELLFLKGSNKLNNLHYTSVVKY